MSTEKFVTFQQHNDKAYALELCNVLKENNIDYLVEESPARFTPTFVGNNELEKEFTIKIHKEDFERAEKIQEDIILQQLDDVDADYYLNHFTDQELMEIVTNRYAWGQFDFLLAQKLLKERGKEINPEVVQLLKNQRLEEMTKSERSQASWIVAGYVSAVLGGIIGVFIALHLITYKKTLPNGDVISVYSDADRKHGLVIFCIAVVVLILSVVSKLMDLF